MEKVKLFIFLVLSLCFSVLIATGEEAHAADMHRLYNPNSGEHFYTATTGEKNHLVKVGWRYEGIGWIAPSSGHAVYRLYNPNAGDHHYTMNANEKNHLVKVGWRYEGIGWYSDIKMTVPLYRAYNPNAKAGSHNYTVNYAEQKNLLRVGWRDEGIAWYGIKKTTPVTKYTVTVRHIGSDGKTLKSATTQVEKGKSYTAKAASFSGYTLKGSSSQTVTVNGNKTITFNYTKNTVAPTKYTVTVKYVDIAGKEIEKATTASVEKGKSYTATAKSIAGYTAKTPTSQKITVNGNQTVTFKYTKNATPGTKYIVTVKYVDKDGKNIRPASRQTVEEGKTFTAEAQEIPDYTVQGNGSQVIKSVNKDETIIFVYTSNSIVEYKITVKYVDEGGNSIKTATTQTIEHGNRFSMTAPTITGYTVKAADKTKDIASVSKNETVTFTYTKNATPVTKYKVTVKHVGSDGKELKKTTEDIEKGKSYTAKAETFTGYTLNGNASQTIKSVNADQTLTFTYNVNKYNVTVVHEGSNGKTLETEKAKSVEYGKEHTAQAKTYTGYTLSGNVTQKVTVKGTTTITFTYIPNKYNVTVVHKGSDGTMLETEKAVSVEYDKEYTAQAKKFAGYTLTGDTRQKVIVDGNTTITFNYTKNVTKYKVTVIYKGDDGLTLATDPFVMVNDGVTYNVDAKEFPGYTLQGNKTQAVNITKDTTITFNYKKNVTKYNVTVEHKGNDGKILLTEPVVSVEQGKTYVANSKTFAGYKLSGNISQTVTVTKDVTITFNYNSLAFDRITLHAVVNGTIVKSVTFDVKPGEKFKPSSDKLHLDPDVYDLVYTWSYAEITGVGGKNDEYRFNISLFKDYLSDTELQIMQQTIIRKVNELRVSLGRSPLEENSKLSAAAAVRSVELKQKFEHIRPDGRDIYTAVAEQGLSIGYPRGENIAMVGNPEKLTSGEVAGLAMFEGWKNSEGHYLNMIDPGYKYIGIGVYCYGSKVYGTQLFTGVIN